MKRQTTTTLITELNSHTQTHNLKKGKELSSLNLFSHVKALNKKIHQKHTNQLTHHSPPISQLSSTFSHKCLHSLSVVSTVSYFCLTFPPFKTFLHYFLAKMFLFFIKKNLSVDKYPQLHYCTNAASVRRRCLGLMSSCLLKHCHPPCHQLATVLCCTALMKGQQRCTMHSQCTVLCIKTTLKCVLAKSVGPKVFSASSLPQI